MDDIRIVLSQPRLKQYGEPNEDISLEKYFFNIRLCESFYPTLSMFEVVLRNKIDLVFSAQMGADWIFEFVKLDDRLIEEQKIKDRNELIDSLTLSFWARLFLRENKALIWDKYPDTLHFIFSGRKHCPNLNKVSFEIDLIRRYRNRFSHNGALLICDKRQIPCYKMHNLLFRLLRELSSRAVLRKLKTIDRFNEVFRQGRELGFLDYEPQDMPESKQPTFEQLKEEIIESDAIE